MDEVIALDGGAGFAILSRAAPARARTTVVLLNAGLIHRTGPFRLYVHLARRLAVDGMDVVRFDLPRVGDGAADGAGSSEAAVLAVFDTISRLTGSQAFVLGGLCSASDLAWRIARTEPRVTGLMLIDGFAYRGHWFRVGRLRRALARPVWQWPMLGWRLLWRARRAAGTVSDQALRDWPNADEFRRDAIRMLERGVRILATYTGGVSRYLLHARQIEATFGECHGHPALDTAYWPRYDHLLLSPIDREVVLERIQAWSRKF